MSKVEIVEVAPRDGLQNIARFVPTEDKISFIRKLRATGIDRMEIGSFVRANFELIESSGIPKSALS